MSKPRVFNIRIEVTLDEDGQYLATATEWPCSERGATRGKAAAAVVESLLAGWGLLEEDGSVVDGVTTNVTVVDGTRN